MTVIDDEHVRTKATESAAPILICDELLVASLGQAVLAAASGQPLLLLRGRSSLAGSALASEDRFGVACVFLASPRVPTHLALGISAQCT